MLLSMTDLVSPGAWGAWRPSAEESGTLASLCLSIAMLRNRRYVRTLGSASERVLTPTESRRM